MADLILPKARTPNLINTLKNQYKNKIAGGSRRWPHIRRSVLCAALAALLGTAFAGPVQAASDSKEDVAAQQAKQIAILKSSAPPQDKALACKRLAIYGSKDAVPALAPLLADKELASWARIALEAIPDPSADAALRKAAGKLHGLLLDGTINSIGVRRDAKAVSTLTSKLKDSDPQVASAAAVALGHIGGDKAAAVLQKSLATTPAAIRPAVAEELHVLRRRIFCAGRMPRKP